MTDEPSYQEPEERARWLLAPLAEGPHRPSTVDIGRAIAEGRRRLRVRRLIGTVAVAVLTGVLVTAVPVIRELGLVGEPAPPAAIGPGAATGAPEPARPDPSPDPGSVAGSTPAPPPPSGCEVERLAEPDGAYQSLVTAADPSGRLLAGRTYTDTGDGLGIEVVLWEDGAAPRPVEVPGHDPRLDDLTTAGVGVGVSYPDASAETATGWVYRGARVERLPGGEIAAVEGLTINEQNVIAGALAWSSDEGDVGAMPVVWPDPDNAPRRLSVPAGDWHLAARAVDTDGTVVGSGYDLNLVPGPPEQSFVWLPDGTRRRLPLPVIDGEPAVGLRAVHIQDRVVLAFAQVERRPRDGWTSTPDGDPAADDSARLAATEAGGATGHHAVRYHLDTDEFTVLDPAWPAYPQAWNRHGWLAGWQEPEGLSLLTPTGGPVTLLAPEPEEPDSAESLRLVQTLSDDGRVLAGQLDDADGYPHATRWLCG